MKLQNANVIRTFQSLGTAIDEILKLWIAAPLTGLLVQSIVGYFSDRTWNHLGHRRLFFQKVHQSYCASQSRNCA